MGEHARDDTFQNRTVGGLVDDLISDAMDEEARVIGHFEVGPPGVGPVADVTTGEFYPGLPASNGATAAAAPD